MNTKLILSCGILLAILGGGSTYAAGAKDALWGDIDESVPSSKEIERQQKALEAQQLKLQNQKTVCDIFNLQPTLTNDAENLAKIQDALSSAYKVTLPEYQSLIANKDAANSLYMQYRDLYLKTYCTATK